MSKEDGKAYVLDRSYLVSRRDTKVANDEHYYYVAPIITDEKFAEEIFQLSNTPDKNPGQGATSTRSKKRKYENTDEPVPPALYSSSSQTPDITTCVCS